MTEKRVICAVILRDGTVFLARRAPGQKHAGLWEFPGGKTESGESDEACLEREMAEEFGVTGKTGAHLCDSEYLLFSSSFSSFYLLLQIHHHLILLFSSFSYPFQSQNYHC